MRLATIILTCVFALPVAAETPLGAADFEALVTGRTLTFGLGGVPYGIEQYLPGRRVVWSFVGGPCRYGVWNEPAPGQICFTYDHDPAPQCWQFFDGPGGLRARFEGADPAEDLVEVERSEAPLLCPGPDVGV